MEQMTYDIAMYLLALIKTKMVDMTEIDSYKNYHEYELQNFRYDLEKQEWWYLTEKEFNILKAFLRETYTESELKKLS